MIPEVDNHLDETGLLQNDQRGAREECPDAWTIY